MYSSYWNSISELRSVMCRMGSHSVTFHPTQVNTPRLNPSQTQHTICKKIHQKLKTPKNVNFRL